MDYTTRCVYGTVKGESCGICFIGDGRQGQAEAGNRYPGIEGHERGTILWCRKFTFGNEFYVEVPVLGLAFLTFSLIIIKC